MSDLTKWANLPIALAFAATPLGTCLLLRTVLMVKPRRGIREGEVPWPVVIRRKMLSQKASILAAETCMMVFVAIESECT